MKIIKFIHTLGHGGAENIFCQLAHELLRNGIEVHACIRSRTEGGEDWVGRRLDELGVPLIRYDNSAPWKEIIKHHKRIIERIRPDIVHSHLLDSNFYSSIACRMAATPHVCTEHGDVKLHGGLKKIVKLNAVNAFSNKIVCVSRNLEDFVTRRVAFKYKVQTIYNGVIAFPRVHSTFRQEFNVPEDATLIGNIANLYPIKGQKFLIEAFARLSAERPNVYLVIVGRGNEETNLRRLMEELHIQKDRVILTGFRKDIANILQSLDLFVQPSLSEGMPVSLLEVMSMGVPVIATNVGGVPEVIRDDSLGVLIPPGSWQAMLTEMEKFSRNPEPFRQKAAYAKTVINDEFSLQKMGLNYIALYRAVANSAPSAHA